MSSSPLSPYYNIEDGNCQENFIKYLKFFTRAGARIRTADLLITSELLYQLSYTSILSSTASIEVPIWKINQRSKAW